MSLRRRGSSRGGRSVKVGARDYLVALEKFLLADENVKLAVNDDDGNKLVGVVNDDHDTPRLNSCIHERAGE